LRKKLKIEKKHFVLCVLGLSQQQAQGMTGMYDLTFVNEDTFVEYIESI